MTAPDHLDAAAVTAVLAAHVDPGLRCDRVERAAVGNGQEIWLIDAIDADDTPRGFILRRSAVSGVLDDTDRELEFATLRNLEGRGLPTPRVHWLETEPSVLQRPFFVMDRMPGGSPAPRTPDDAAAIARDLGRQLAHLHAAAIPIDHTDVRTTTLREIEKWRARYLARRAGPLPMIGSLLAWLEAGPPAADVPPLLLWGDPGPHNILVEGTRISALLDWELSHTGHPIEDLGGAVWACLGRYPEDEVVAGYEEVAGTGVDRELLAYFTVLACVSRSVMQLAGVESFVAGQSSALNLAGLGLTLPIANLRRAAVYARWPVADNPEPVATGSDDDLRLRPDVTETLDGIARFLADDVLPQAGSAHLQRGLKTAVGLLRASSRRSREEPVIRKELGARVSGLFDRLEAAGVVEPGGPRDAAAMEAAAARVESEPRYVDSRDDVRRTLLADMTARFASLDDISRLYGRDVKAGPPFRR